MDMVVIGSPSGLHAAQGIAAPRHGLHVLTEKPVDVSVQRADELIEATDRARLKLGVIFQDSCEKRHSRRTKLLGDLLIGKPLLAEAKVKSYRPAEYYGGSKW